MRTSCAVWFTGLLGYKVHINVYILYKQIKMAVIVRLWFSVLIMDY